MTVQLHIQIQLLYTSINLNYICHIPHTSWATIQLPRNAIPVLFCWLNLDFLKFWGFNRIWRVNIFMLLHVHFALSCCSWWTGASLSTLLTLYICSLAALFWKCHIPIVKSDLQSITFSKHCLLQNLANQSWLPRW